MKLNWGTSIAIFIGLFIAFMAFMVIKTLDHPSELVAIDYYEKEVAYQGEIDGKENLRNSGKTLNYHILGHYMYVKIPISVANNKIDGDISFLRPSDQTLDQSFKLDMDSVGVHQVDLRSFVNGLYIMTVKWNENDTPYRFESDIILP